MKLHENGIDSNTRLVMMLPVHPSLYERVFFSFVWVEASRPSQQFFSHVGQFSWIEPVLNNEDEMFCKDTTPRPWKDSNPQHCDQESGTLPTELMVLPS